MYDAEVHEGAYVACQLRTSPHPVSAAVAAEAGRYLAVIEHVLALDFLKPDLRTKVVRMQRQLIEVELNKAEGPAETPA